MLRYALLLIMLATAGVRAQTTQDEFFGLDKIWDIHITVAADDWKQLFPQGGRSATRMFGKFSYRTADVTVGSHAFKNVGLRMKGNATFAATSGTLKRSLKIDFNRFEKGQKFLGMGKINLQCNALDGTQIKEAVSYEIYRSCGIVAGRTCFARVFLTMTGEFERTYIGLYHVVEQVDQRFAKRTMGGGLILKPDGETLGYFGDRWNDEYARVYHPKSTVTDDLTRPLVATAALFDEPDPKIFARWIEAVMDMESFLKYTAATAILVNTDSPLTVPDNYYLIVSRKTKKVMWVPWDMNWSLGEFGHVTDGPTDDLSIMAPSKKDVFRKVLEIPRFRKRYREIATEFIEGPASAKEMIAAIRRAHMTVKTALAEEAKRPEAVTQAKKELGGRPSRRRSLRTRPGDDAAGLEAYALAREKSVRDQLAGKSEGRTARNLFGSNSRTLRGVAVRDALATSGALDVSKENHDAAAMDRAVPAGFRNLDKDGSGRLDQDELGAAVRRRSKTARRRQAGRALAGLDTDGDAAVTLEEWKTTIKGLLRYWDRDLDGRWSREELNLTEK